MGLCHLCRLDDYYYECEKMHGAEKTRLVADSLLKAVDFIERTAKEVRQGAPRKGGNLDNPAAVTPLPAHGAQ